MIRAFAICLFAVGGLQNSTNGWTPPTRTKSIYRKNIPSLLQAAAPSQLEQLADMTVLSIDSGDLEIIKQYAATNCITDATTNPLFVCQAGLSGDPVYAKMVDNAVDYSLSQRIVVSSKHNDDDKSAMVELAMDRLAVNLGAQIAQIVPGFISTEVDPRLSFDTEQSIVRARRIIDMYDGLGISKDRVLIKLAATWEGIQAASILKQQDGIRSNLTLIFSTIQAIACAQYGAHLISPFPGRILDWHKNKLQRDAVETADLDEGVQACRYMHEYFKAHNHDTICMPASWRPSRGPGFELDEIRALAGTDRMTIPPPLLEQLANSYEPMERHPTLVPQSTVAHPVVGNGKISEAEFRYRLCLDGCGNDKLAEGIQSFCGLTEELEAAIATKVQAATRQTT